MQRSTPTGRAVSPTLVLIALLGFVLVTAAPGAAAPFGLFSATDTVDTRDDAAGAPAWARHLPAWLQAWTTAFFDRFPATEDGTAPVAVHDRAGSGLDPNGSPGPETTSTDLDGPTIEPTVTDPPSG